LPDNRSSNEWLGINPGRLRHSIEFQEPNETQDNSGFPVPAWPLFAASRASVEPLTGNELFQARQLHAEVTHKVIARYVAGIVPTHRIVFGSRAFDILSIRNIEERNLLLEIMAKERV
jgi:SPP1 family predicted phage head-tail adaptor